MYVGFFKVIFFIISHVSALLIVGESQEYNNFTFFFVLALERNDSKSEISLRKELYEIET